MKKEQNLTKKLTLKLQDCVQILKEHRREFNFYQYQCPQHPDGDFALFCYMKDQQTMDRWMETNGYTQQDVDTMYENGNAAKIPQYVPTFLGRVEYFFTWKWSFPARVRAIYQAFRSMRCVFKPHDIMVVNEGGDAESGPIIYTACRYCGEGHTHFGM